MLQTSPSFSTTCSLLSQTTDPRYHFSNDPTQNPANMSAHKEITSKEDFENAIKTEGKYVFIYAYEGEVSPEAEE